MNASANVFPADLDEARAELRAVLGLEREVPVAAARRAALDPVYLHRLLVSRSSRPMLERVLADPGNERFATRPPPEDTPSPEAGEPAPGARERTGGELARKAASAIAGWAKAGFALASLETVERRLAACEACPNLAAAGDQLAYRLLAGGGERKSVCSLCGCVVRHKAKLPNESCPDADPQRPGFTRWGDALAD